MLSRLTILTMLGLVIAFIVGCGPSVRRDTVNILPCDTKGHDRCSITQPDKPILVEYVQTGSAWVTGASLRYHADGYAFGGRVEAHSFTALLPSKAIRVEVIDQAHQVSWAGLTPIDRKRNIRIHRSRKGSFQTKIPIEADVDHLHVGIVSRSHSDAVLPMDCSAKSGL